MQTTENKIQEEVEKIHSFLYKEYLYHLKDDYVIGDYEKMEPVKFDERPYGLKVNSWVERLEKKDELLGDKFKNIFAAFNNTGATLAMLVARKNCNCELYFFVSSADKMNQKRSRDLLSDIIQSNFPGSSVIKYEPKTEINSNIWVSSEKTKDELPQEINIDDIFSDKKNENEAVVALTAVASEKSDKFISQGLEKLFDVPGKEDFSILILSKSLIQQEVENARNGYESLGTEISPFAVTQNSDGQSIANSLSEMKNEAHTHGVNESISKSITGSVSANVGGKIGPVNVGGSISVSKGKTTTKGTSDADTKSTGTVNTTAKTITKNTTLTITDYQIKDSVEKIQEQIKRIDIGKALGLWQTAAYVYSATPSVAENVANVYKGIIQGEKSFIEPCVVNEWYWNDREEADKKTCQNILKAIKRFEHPVFFNKADIDSNEKIAVTPAVFVNTSELAQQMCFPKHSIKGLPFLRCAEFGREIVSFDQPQLEETDTIRLGKVFHMHREEDTEIRLNKKNLTSHTFITGSTGSGKSNTVYQLLNGLTNNLEKEDVHFLVIEPAKGEYKNVFGHKKGVTVYGTNPSVSKVLHINPFSFPEGIHILEHLDRLIEIFNVCWPMYAAMPAVLKEAVEKSYEDAGWNLAKSENEYETNFYPSFADVARNIRIIIDTSEYDAENKGAYKGSLVTRLASLTNGLNGQIFTSTEEDDINAIFNENTIVDLSRVGSAETKSLIMGLLVLKLQEYRMSSTKQMNSELKHITVLEEAHNLLKRTSTEQSMESSNLAGKSVEMLTNAIAEMRTYGEGFIIADQAPALLDMAVIRNTNTKIIMRLPDQSDRELVGKAANLNDEQITELSRLPCGVAAVYQNEWIQPVLCKIDKYDSKEKAYLKPDDSKDIEEDLKKRGCIIDKLLNKTEVKLDDLSGIKTSGSIKASILNYQKTYREYPLSLGRIFSELIPEGSKKMEELIASQTDVSEWKDVLQEVIIPYSIESENLNKVIQSIITESMYRDINHRQILLDTFTNYCKGVK